MKGLVSRPWSALCPLLLALLPAGGIDADSPERLLEEGYYLEAALCDPRSALEVYKRVLDLKPRSRRISALARLHLGICHDLLGERDLAREQLRQTIEQHGAETDIADLARRHLHSLSPGNPARFLPESVLLYAELVNPRQQARTVTNLLKGTRFNPVDYTVSYLEGLPRAGGDDPASAPRAPDWMEKAAAVLNREFLNELEKIDGLAIGVLPGAGPESDHLVVFIPGESDLVLGLIKMVLSIERPLGSVRGVPIYGFSSRRERPGEGAGERYLAFTDDFVLAGRPRGLVEGAVERYFAGGPSLASNPEFRKAQAVRAGSFLFSYLGREWLDALRGPGAGEGRALFDALRATFGLDRLRPLSMTLSSDPEADSLRFTLEAWLEGGRAEPALEALQTPPLDLDLVRAAPEGSLGFLALRLDRGAERWRALERAGAALAAGLAGEEAAKLREGMKRLDTLVLESPGRELVDALRGLVIGARHEAEAPFPSPASFYAALELEDPVRGERLLREALPAALHGIFKTAASRHWGASELELGAGRWTLHHLEPLPGTRLAYARHRRLFVISFSRQAIEEGLAAAARPGGRFAAGIPEGAAKLLFLRPAAILESLGERPTLRLQERLFLSHVNRLLLSSREGSERLALELEVPEFTPTFRNLLNTLARWLEPSGEAAELPSGE
jgi:tetratricopeptide (TPR) repeat protein